MASTSEPFVRSGGVALKCFRILVLEVTGPDSARRNPIKGDHLHACRGRTAQGTGMARQFLGTVYSVLVTYPATLLLVPTLLSNIYPATLLPAPTLLSEGSSYSDTCSQDIFYTVVLAID